MIKQTALAAFGAGMLLLAHAASAQSLQDIRREIQIRNARWTAAENPISAKPPEERRRLCGTRLERPRTGKNALIDLGPAGVQPETLDWRDRNGDWLTPVKDQGGCGSCWAFGATAQVESWLKIHGNRPEAQIDLSEQVLVSCTDGDCQGGWPGDALEYFRTVGVPAESCLPYQASDTVPCELLCSDGMTSRALIPGWGFVTLEEPVVETIKNALMRHPVTATMTVYTDFYYYAGGAYEHVFGDFEGGHAVLIVGWNDAEQSWICKNSWGPLWGLSGYFRIKWGQCGIGEFLPFVWSSVPAGPSLTVSDEAFHFTLPKGENRTAHLILTNQGSGDLEFSAVEYTEKRPPFFHPESEGAWDGMSLWNGDTEIGGYGDHWLQEMDLPPVDLSAAAFPELRFMTAWSIEPPAEAAPPWDGWDGFNVRCSADGGRTFTPMEPSAPPYTCRSLYGFGDPGEGWDQGPGVPGWAGSSGGWTQAVFDLSDFRSEQVVVRFAFASDMAYATVDDPAVTGVYLDEIRITDGGKSLLVLDGSSTADLDQRSFGGRNEAADWLSLTGTGGVIGPGMNTAVELQIHTAGLDSGGYSAILHISSNDTSRPEIQIPVTLNVTEPGASHTGPAPDTPPLTFHLNPVYPNPFNGSAVVSWRVPQTAYVRVELFDITGRRIATLWNGELRPGRYERVWNAKDSSGVPVGSGVVVIRARCGPQTRTRKAVLIQ